MNLDEIVKKSIPVPFRHFCERQNPVKTDSSGWWIKSDLTDWRLFTKPPRSRLKTAGALILSFNCSLGKKCFLELFYLRKTYKLV